MPRTRSRPKTEEKFQNAVLELVANEGCGALGINAVAQLAGSDKVLIYRYFGDFNGLLQQVADSRQWLPTAHEVFHTLPFGNIDAPQTLRKIEEALLHHVRGDASTYQLVRWRRAIDCPLCKKFTEEWRHLWHTLPQLLSQGLSMELRQAWTQACGLLALTIEAKLCEESVDRQCHERIALGLQGVEIDHASPAPLPVEESLPTNLL